MLTNGAFNRIFRRRPSAVVPTEAEMVEVGVSTVAVGEP
jgi:hypothetical protein